MLTQEKLREYLRYHESSGMFEWVKTPGFRTDLLGTTAGYVTGRKKDRLYIELFGKSYIASRLAWFYMTGKWPENQIDHIDRNPLNNSWGNLREATSFQNAANRFPTRKKCNLPKGVTLNGRKYEAAIKINGKRKYLGIFDTPELASEAYNNASKNLYGEYSWV